MCLELIEKRYNGEFRFLFVKIDKVEKVLFGKGRNIIYIMYEYGDRV